MKSQKPYFSTFPNHGAALNISGIKYDFQDPPGITVSNDTSPDSDCVIA
ncbi:MAG: hypothetical protein IJH05_04460 [Firmicutes bacterium]|nr:hypothetical protein [Bacillota bacterium]